MVCFTDQPDLKAPGYEVRVVTPAFPDPRMAARYIKIMAHEVLGPVDWSIWFDAETIFKTGRLTQLVASVAPSTFATYAHPVRRCIYVEAAVCKNPPRRPWPHRRAHGAISSARLSGTRGTLRNRSPGASTRGPGRRLSEPGGATCCAEAFAIRSVCRSLRGNWASRCTFFRAGSTTIHSVPWPGDQCRRCRPRRPFPCAPDLNRPTDGPRSVIWRRRRYFRRALHHPSHRGPGRPRDFSSLILPRTGGDRPRDRFPLGHYLTVGWRQNLDPHPLFDVSFYLERSPDVSRSGVEPLGHYINRGGREGRSPHALFDVARYVREYGRTCSDMEGGSLSHYVTRGWRRGFRPNTWFDPVAYLQRYEDIEQADVEPFGHFLRYGGREGRVGSNDDAR